MVINLEARVFYLAFSSNNEIFRRCVIENIISTRTLWFHPNCFERVHFKFLVSFRIKLNFGLFNLRHRRYKSFQCDLFNILKEILSGLDFFSLYFKNLVDFATIFKNLFDFETIFRNLVNFVTMFRNLVKINKMFTICLSDL